MPCGQNGREDQLCTSRTGPIAPAWIHSAICGVDSVPAAQNMWVAAPVSRAVLDDEPRLVKEVADRLVDDDVLAGLHRREGDRRVEVVGGHDVDGVEVLLLRQHLAEVGVGVAAPAGGRGVVPVDQLAAHLAPAGTGLGALGPAGIGQELADLVPQLEAGPLDVVLALAIGVADRGDPQVRPLQRGHELSEPLGAVSHVGDVDAIARAARAAVPPGRDAPRASRPRWSRCVPGRCGG